MSNSPSSARNVGPCEASSPLGNVRSVGVGPYEPCESIDKRFPDLVGGARWDHIMKTYVRKRTRPLMIWDIDGRRRAWRHMRLNGRQQQTVVSRLAQSFLKRGGLFEFRGKLFHIEADSAHSSGSEADDLLIAGATFVEAIVLASEIAPNSVHAMYIREKGIVGTYDLTPGTPDDILKWIKVQANEFHEGSAATFIEVLDEAAEAQAEWTVHADLSQIKVRTCPSHGEFRYEKQYSTFVEEKHDVFKNNWQKSDNAKSFVNGMKNLGLWADYKSLCEQRANFLHRDINNDVILKLNHEMLVLFQKNFETNYDPVHVQAAPHRGPAIHHAYNL